MLLQRRTDKETPSGIVNALEEDVKEDRTGFHRLRNALLLQRAKQKVEEHKTEVKTTSSEMMPEDIASLTEIIAQHPELCGKEKRTITLHTNYPFLMRANWTHDKWGGSEAMMARNVNNSQVCNSLMPVLAAVDALLEKDPRSERLLLHITCQIMRSLRNSVPVLQRQVREMRQRCMTLKNKHDQDIPSNVTRADLCEADMTGIFLAVLIKVWYDTRSTDLLEDKLLRAEEDTKSLKPLDVDDILETHESWLKSNESGDLDLKARFEQRLQTILQQKSSPPVDADKVNEKDAACSVLHIPRSRIKTDRFADVVPEVKTSAPKKKKAQPVAETVGKRKRETANINKLQFGIGDGVLCTKQGNDECWFRAEITKITKKGFTVRYVEAGE